MSGAANDMSATLSEVFGTKLASAATPEDLEKRAQAEFFTSLCKEQGIDIKDLTDPQVDDLWKTAMEIRKEAGEMPPQFAKKDEDEGKDEGKKDDKKDGKEKEASDTKVAAAEAEFAAIKTAATKVAEADAMGRIMAHSFVEELSKIAGDGGFPFAPKKDGDEEKSEKKDNKKEEAKEKEASSAEKAAALVQAFRDKTAGAPAASGASTTQNFDELACYRAIDMLKQAGVDGDEAFNRVNAVYTLGLTESTKLAAAADANAGLEIRALEVCEAAGYPVEWKS